MTRSQSQSFAENDTAVSCDIFGKEVSASDHVSAIDSLMKKKQKYKRRNVNSKRSCGRRKGADSASSERPKSYRKRTSSQSC